MRLLALETATVEVGAAIVVDGEVRALAATRPGRRHAETLHPAVEAACALGGVALAELDALAVDVGPGLFTGLRVGIAAAKAYAFALGLPLVTCTSTDVLHHATRQVAGAVVAVVDMRRGELAFSLRPPDACSGTLAADTAGEAHRGESACEAHAAGEAHRGSTAGPLRLAGPEGLAAALVALGAPVLAVGDGARRYGDRLTALVAEAGGGPLCLGGPELDAPPVASLGVLAADRLAAAGPGGPGRRWPGWLDPEAVEPVYLRPVDARINWTTRDAPAGAGSRSGGS